MSKSTVSPIELQEQASKESKEHHGPTASADSEKTKNDDNEDRKNSVLLWGWKFPFKWFHILTIIGWVIMIGLMLYYIFRQSISYIEAMGKPTTSLTWEHLTSLALPAITICNWNAGPSDCNACALQFSGAVDFQRPEGKPYNAEEMYYKEIVQGGNNFHCYVFNNITDTDRVLKSTIVGYNGIRSLYFSINDPKPEETKITRAGLIVSFHKPGTDPDLLSETNYAQPALDNYFMIAKHVTKMLNSPTENIYWTSKNTNLKFLGTDGLTVAVTYTTLNVEHIEEVMTTSIEGLLGELAGMLGLLMGIDILKIIRGLLEIPLIFREKSTMELWDNFN